LVLMGGLFRGALQVSAERFLNLRYDGTDVAVMIRAPADGDFRTAFDAEYQREFGFVLEDRAVLADDVRVRATGKSYMYESAGTDGAAAGEAADVVSYCDCSFRPFCCFLFTHCIVSVQYFREH
jgi:N-methylhydantoinase A/oxoprolinase/acetone carboxylase beta subunit